MIWSNTGIAITTTPLIPPITSAIPLPVPASGNVVVANLVNTAGSDSYAISGAVGSLQNVATGALTTRFLFSWYADAMGMQLLAQDAWTVWATDGILSSAWPFTGSGPVKGPYLKVTAFNIGTTSMNINSLNLTGTTVPLVISSWSQDTSPAASFATASTLTVVRPSFAYNGSNLLGDLMNHVSTAGVNYLIPLGIADGPTTFYFNSAAATSQTWGVGSASVGKLASSFTAGANEDGIVLSLQLGNTSFPGGTSGVPSTYVLPRGPVWATLAAGTSTGTFAITVGTENA